MNKTMWVFWEQGWENAPGDYLLNSKKEVL